MLNTFKSNHATADARPCASIPVETIGGLPVAAIDRATSARLMIDLAVARRNVGARPLIFTSANGQVISMCARNAGVRKMFLDADLIHADGMPMVFASRLLCKSPLPERVATTDLFHDVAATAAQADVTFYLLGASVEINNRAAQRARALYPRIRIVGHRSGYFSRGEEARVVAEINAARPDILWVGMGAPAELRFAMRHRERLRGVGLIKTSGGLFDFLSGKNARAPLWMQSAGLEWAYRIYREPKRLAGRYLMTNPHALFLLLTQTADRQLSMFGAVKKGAQTLVAAMNSDVNGAGWPSVTLCIPTFRRPNGLRKLLTHVGKLDYRGRISVIVVDNDGERREGEAIVTQCAPLLGLPIVSIAEHRRGQTYAYNRGFLAACRSSSAPDYVAVLDDDEYPDPRWLTEMVTAAMRFEADIVGGPVFPKFDDPSHWLARSGLYEPRRYETGRVDMIYGAGSMLIRCAVLEDYLDEPFSHAFAFTGGSDYEFFTRCRIEGRSFAWADDAHVFETTSRARTTVRWILLRHFRKGTEASRIERALTQHGSGIVSRWYRGLGLLAYGIATLPIAAFSGRRAIMDSLNFAARGAGRIAAEFNLLYEEYR